MEQLRGSMRPSKDVCRLLMEAHNNSKNPPGPTLGHESKGVNMDSTLLTIQNFGRKSHFGWTEVKVKNVINE